MAQSQINFEVWLHMILEMVCDKCAVSTTCPKKGSSPISISTSVLKCKIIGGFGTTPMDRSSMSEESIKTSDRDGPCLTVAEVPRTNGSSVEWDVVKIFAPPYVPDRDKKVIVTSSDVTARSHK
jgi:hypothetical protein